MGMPFKVPTYCLGVLVDRNLCGRQCRGCLGQLSTPGTWPAPITSPEPAGAPGAMNINSSSRTAASRPANWQIGQHVLGLEQDYQFTGLKQTATFAAPAGAFFAWRLRALSIPITWPPSRAKLGMAGIGPSSGGRWPGDRRIRRDLGLCGGAAPAARPRHFTRCSNKLHFGFNVGAGIDYCHQQRIHRRSSTAISTSARRHANLGAPSCLRAQPPRP